LRNALREQSEDIDVALGAGLSSPARLDALSSGAIDIALASHGLEAKDLGARGLTAHRIAVTAVVFAVHADVGLLDLSPGDFCDIFSGRVASWDAVGGPKVPVRAFLRPDSEVDTEVARAAIPCMKDLVPGKDVAIAQTSNDMRIALQSTPGAIGLTTGSAVLQSIVALRTLSIASVSPTPGNVVSGRYPLVRPAYLVTLASPSPSVRRFLAFVRSDLGAEAIRKAGAFPVN
jgi:phosphate transport system substrate-binding protein